MVKLPILQQLLKRKENNEQEWVVLKTCCYSGVNFVLLVRKSYMKDEELLELIKHTFVTMMDSDSPLSDVFEAIETKGICIADHFLLERSMFIMFEKEL